MQLVEHKDIDAGKLAPELLQAGLGSAQAQDVAAPARASRRASVDLPQPGGPNRSRAWKARAFQERGQALGEVALSDEEGQFGGAQAFRQRLRQGHEGSKLARRGGYR